MGRTAKLGLFPQNIVFSISSSAANISWVFLSWNVMPCNLLVLLNLVHSVCDKLLYSPRPLIQYKAIVESSQQWIVLGWMVKAA